MPPTYVGGTASGLSHAFGADTVKGNIMQEEKRTSMSTADNHVTLTGNLTKDPELRFTQTGRARTVLGLAVNRRWLNRQTNDWEEQVSFFNVVCWGDLAEHVAESVSKGNRVSVTGRLEQRSWETPDGDRRSVVEVVADEVSPSLRWATAAVTRTPNSQGTQGAPAPSDSAPPPQASEEDKAAATASLEEEPF